MVSFTRFIVVAAVDVAVDVAVDAVSVLGGSVVRHYPDAPGVREGHQEAHGGGREGGERHEDATVVLRGAIVNRTKYCP